MVLESHVKLWMTEPDFPGKFFTPQKLRKWIHNGLGVFQFIGKFGH